MSKENVALNKKKRNRCKKKKAIIFSEIPTVTLYYYLMEVIEPEVIDEILRGNQESTTRGT